MEHQRTGIVFCGGEGPSPEKAAALVAEAGGRRCVLIAAADSGLLAAEAAGLRPDWVLGDMDSLGAENLPLLGKYPPDRVLRCDHDKDYTDTELALNLLWEHGCAETWVSGGGGGRLDHLLAIRSLFERPRCPRRWLTAAEDVRVVEAAPQTAVLSADLPPGSIVSVFPAGPGPWKAVSRGLKWPLDTVAWTRGFAGISNVVEKQAAVEIRAESGRFLAVLPV